MNLLQVQRESQIVVPEQDDAAEVNMSASEPAEASVAEDEPSTQPPVEEERNQSSQGKESISNK